jgi:hypothetical protein
MNTELTEQDRAALNALDFSEIIGTPEERIGFALKKAMQYLRERNTAQASAGMAWAEHAQRVVEIEQLRTRVAELEAENAALADDVHCLSPSDPLTEQDCEALMAVLTGDAGEGVV